MAHIAYWLIALAGAVLLALFSNELFAWLPALNRRIVTAASRQLRDPEMRERFSEEWQSFVADIPGPVVGLLHALSLFVSIRKFERDWAAAVTADDVENYFADLSRDIQEFAHTLVAAREALGLTLEDVTGVTKISLRTLKAFERGHINHVPGGLFERAYLRELSGTLGLNPDAVWSKYSLLFRRVGFGPATPRPRPSPAARFMCRVRGHRAYTRHIHSEGSPFHWTYRECERCGDVSPMWSARCSGRTVRVKREADSPAVTVYSCDEATMASPWMDLEAEHRALVKGLKVDVSSRRSEAARRGRSNDSGDQG
jgi:hypothetical protein